MMSEQREKEIEEYAKSSPALTAKGAEMIYDLLSEVRTLRADSRKIRELLAIRHGHPIYTDDGKLACSKCQLDFGTASALEIESEFVKQGFAALAKETP